MFNEGFSHHDGRNVDILQMGPALDIHIRSELETTKEGDKSQTLPERPPPGCAPVGLLISCLGLLEIRSAAINPPKQTALEVLYFLSKQRKQSVAKHSR